MNRYEYKTRRILFKNMALCNLTVSGSEMEIMPMRHEKLEAWGGLGLDGNENVLVSMDSSSDQIGKALRMAFSRCE